MNNTKRSFWGWGFEESGPDEHQAAAIVAGLSARLETPLELRDPPRIEDLDLPEPRLTPPASLEKVCSQDPRERARHCYGRSFYDLVRGARGDFRCAPDWVAFPSDEAEVAAFMDWCGSEGVALIP